MVVSLKDAKIYIVNSMGTSIERATGYAMHISKFLTDYFTAKPELKINLQYHAMPV